MVSQTCFLLVNLPSIQRQKRRTSAKWEEEEEEEGEREKEEELEEKEKKRSDFWEEKQRDKSIRKTLKGNG